MTVSELIEKLRLLDQSLTVLTPGFDESGFDDIVVSVRRMAEYRRSLKSVATYTDLHSEDDPHPVESVFYAVVISFD